MSNNPTCTLIRPVRVALCLAGHPERPDLICSRINDHTGHCCDEQARVAWCGRRLEVPCRRWGYDHSKEKEALQR